MGHQGDAPITLGSLLDCVAGVDRRSLAPAERAAPVRGVTDDSRAVAPGWIFVARRGERADGLAFADAAVRAGAVAVLVDRGRAAELPAAGVPVLESPDLAPAAARLAEAACGRPSRDLFLAGVTGTNGKSTVCHLVARLLDAAGVPGGLIGTIEIRHGEGAEPASLTTPTAFETSRWLARMRGQGLRAVAMEASSHAIAQSRVAGLAFDAAVFTNLSGDHLDYHKTMDAYARAKAGLFALLGPDARAVVNADDPRAAEMLAASRAQAVRCSEHDATADVRPSVLEDSLDGLALRLETPWGPVEGRTRLVGRHNLMNVAQAVAVAQLAGASAGSLAGALPLLDAPPGRLERVDPGGDAPPVLVDYAHTDAALAATLASLRPLATDRGGRLVALFGCGGERDRTKRPRMARAAADHADLTVLTSDNPRREDPRAIIDEVLAGLDAEERRAVHVEPDRAAAIALAIGLAGARDVVLIAGKGHETEQLVPDGKGGIERRHFDDREVARGLLERRYPSLGGPGTSPPSAPPGASE
jgi:UDP-N-acetylmuramoyl-L-alanyl-D-glutamate--2,6-diaminopimelate ligase